MAKVASDKSGIIRDIPMACADERTAVEFLEAMRWGDEPARPRCGDLDVYQMRSRDGGRNARFLWQCRGCGDQFTVRIGTIMEESRIPLRHWCYAFWAACASKKGVSALQIKRQTGLSYKSALYLMHRVRFAMSENGNGRPLSGDVEVDETYVGGKPPVDSLETGVDGDTPKRPGPDPERLHFDLPWEEVARRVVRKDPKKNEPSEETEGGPDEGEEG